MITSQIDCSNCSCLAAGDVPELEPDLAQRVSAEACKAREQDQLREDAELYCITSILCLHIRGMRMPWAGSAAPRPVTGGGRLVCCALCMALTAGCAS